MNRVIRVALPVWYALIGLLTCGLALLGLPVLAITDYKRSWAFLVDMGEEVAHALIKELQ